MKKITITNFLIVISFTAWSQAFNEKVTVEDGSDNQLDLIQSSGKSWQFRVGTSGSMIFKDDGVERLRFDQNGNVGIGTTSPDVKLDIAGSGTSTTITRLNSGGHANFRQSRGSSSYDGGYFFLTGSTIDWRFQESANASDLHIKDESLGTNIMTFQNNTGNVGIGTTSPSNRVTIQDEADDHIGLIQSTGKSWQFRVGTSGSMIFKDDGVERLRFDQNGNVGIGTTSPNVKLDIAGSGTSTTITRLNSGGHANFRQSRGSSSYDGGYFFLTGSTIDWRFQESANTSDLHIRDESLGSNIMTFQNNTGNVGIGTNDPLSKLAVEGQIRATEVKVLSDISVPDYVFEPDYELRTLKETKEYITENKHLPEIPSASEISENGIDLGNMNMSLLKKIEELTLYQIQLLERLEKAEEKILKLENE